MMRPRSAYVKRRFAPPSPKERGESFQFVDISDAELGKLRAQAIKVQSQLARLEAFAGLLFFRKPLGRKSSHFGSRIATYDSNTIRIGNNDIARPDSCSGTNNRNIDRTGCGFYCSLSGDRFRPDGKQHLRKISHVTNTGIDHQSGNAVGASGFSE